MGKENTLDPTRKRGLHTVDHFSGNIIRKTDNSLKDFDLPGISQDPEPLKLDKDGLPKGWRK